MVSWNSDLLEKHIAPDIGNFTEADIPDLRANYQQSNYWLTNHFLNNSLIASFKAPIKQYVQNFIFRTEVLFRLYHEARDATQDYLDGNDPCNPRISSYYKAISIWEMVFLNWAVAFDLIVKLNENRKQFAKGDGSKEERIHEMQNEIKHCGGSIFGGHWSETNTIPVWLSNEGISSHNYQITFSELASLVSDAANLANDLQDPQKYLESN